MEQRWYVVYTKPHHEKKVAELLTRKKIQNYCPYQKAKRHSAGYRKIIREALFPSFVFVRVSEAEIPFLKTFEGIINPLYWMGKPAVVSDAEVNAIRKFQEEYADLQLEPIAVSGQGEPHISYGQLMYMEGQGSDGLYRRIRVALPSLGYSLVATAFSLQKLTLG